MSYSRSVTFEQGDGGFNAQKPRLVRMVTNAPLSVVTAAGWYKQPPNNNVEALQPSDKVEIAYSQGTSSAATDFFNVSISASGVVTLSIANADVVLPVVSGDFANFTGTSGAIHDAGYSPSDPAKTKVVMANGTVIANHIATYTDTAGTIGEDAATAINGGNIQAGLSGTKGGFSSFPATAAKGSFVFQGVENTGNTVTTFSNDPMGQASTINVPDPVNAIGQVLLGATATPFISGNFPKNSGTAGLMVDSGIAAADIVSKTAVNTFSGSGSIILPKVNGTEAANAVTANGVAGVITTSALTTVGGSSYAITWTNAEISATSVILLSISGGTNTTQNITFTIVPGAGSATLTIFNNTAATALNGTILISYLVI